MPIVATYMEEMPFENLVVCECDKTDESRHHQHNITGQHVKWEWCYALSHCPSICDGIIYKHTNRHGSFQTVSGGDSLYKGKHRTDDPPNYF